jgi:predicted nucleic acid-binding protein
MDVVIDTCAILAVVLGESDRDRMIQLASGNTLVAPGSLRWEMGNAVGSLLKRGRLSLDKAGTALQAFETVPIRYTDVVLSRCMELVRATGLYAYDTYFLECAMRRRAPLLTLDRALQRAARELGIRLLEG